MSFGLPERIGLSAGVISWATLAPGTGFGGRSRRLQPYLILDFVGPSTSGVSLDANFTSGTTGTYEAYEIDASQPQAGFINIQVWS